MYPELQATVAATNKNLKTMWEKDNVDDRDFVSTAKAMSNEMAEYWVERNRRMATEKKEAAEKKETAPAPPLAGPEAYMEIPIAEEPSIQKLSKEIEEYEHGAKNPMKRDNIRALFTSKSDNSKSTTHRAHAWNQLFDEEQAGQDWKHHYVRDFNTEYVEDYVKYKHTMRN